MLKNLAGIDLRLCRTKDDADTGLFQLRQHLPDAGVQFVFKHPLGDKVFPVELDYLDVYKRQALALSIYSAIIAVIPPKRKGHFAHFSFV